MTAKLKITIQIPTKDGCRTISEEINLPTPRLFNDEPFKLILKRLREAAMRSGAIDE